MPIEYKAGDIVFGVISFNGRDGVVVLLSSDVTDALGYTPENVANKATVFTTVNNTLYPTVQAVVDYVNTFPPGGVISFNTRTGAVVLLSADVTAALGFTPAPVTGGSGYVQNGTGAVNQNFNLGTGAGVLTLLTASGNVRGNTMSVGAAAGGVDIPFYIGYTAFTGTSQRFMFIGGIFKTIASGTFLGVDLRPSISAGVNTITTVILFSAVGGALNGNTVSNYSGFSADANLASLGGTITALNGFLSDIAAGTGRRNFNATGTAANSFMGNMLIGTNTDDGVNKLQVAGSAKISSTLSVANELFTSAAPTPVPVSSAIGTGGTITIVGTNSCGTITINTGASGITTAGSVCNFNLSGGFFATNDSIAFLYPRNAQAQLLNPSLTVGGGTAGWSIATQILLTASTTYIFNYQVMFY